MLLLCYILFKMKKHIIILSILLSQLTSCSAQKSLSTYFDNKIQQAYSEHWVAGVRGGGSGTSFTIEFNKMLPEDIALVQVYFLNNKAKITKITETRYQASITGQANWERKEMPETDGQPKVTIVESPIKIEDNEAVLEYTHKGVKKHYKISPVKEKEPLYYPSVRPRN